MTSARKSTAALKTRRRSGWALVVLSTVGAGCQFIAGVDRSSLGEPVGSGGSTGLGGTMLGTGGMSGSGGTDMVADDGSAGMGGPGAGGSSDSGGSGGGAGNGGTPLDDSSTGMTGGAGGADGGGGTIVAGTGGGIPDGGPSCGAPTGWALVVYSTSSTASCPAGYGTARNASTGTPVVGAGACTCACSVSQQGNCTQGTLAGSAAPGMSQDSCVNTFTATVTDTGCTPLSPATPAESVQATALAPVGGTCSPGTAVPNNAAVTATQQRWCDTVPVASANGVCNGTAAPPTGFSACLMTTGNATCPPAGAPAFTTQMRVNDAVSVTCGACSACTVRTTCSNPTVTVFTGTNCAAQVGATVASNGVCNGLGSSNEPTIASLMYSATADTTCTSGTSTGTGVFSGPRTFCCR